MWIWQNSCAVHLIVYICCYRMWCSSVNLYVHTIRCHVPHRHTPFVKGATEIAFDSTNELATERSVKTRKALDCLTVVIRNISNNKSIRRTNGERAHTQIKWGNRKAICTSNAASQWGNDMRMGKISKINLIIRFVAQRHGRFCFVSAVNGNRAQQHDVNWQWRWWWRR